MELRYIAIGIYNSERNLIGYKIDSFWSLSTEWAKPHPLQNGTIPEVLINNLQVILNATPENMTNNVSQVFNNIKVTAKEKFFPDNKKYFIGWSFFDTPTNKTVTFTHKIIDNVISEI